MTGKTNGSFPFGNSTGPLYDHYARRWFVNLATAMEEQARSYIEANGEPEDYHIFHARKEGRLGLEVSAHIHKDDYGLKFWFYLSVNKYNYEKWAKENMFLMEGVLTFRLGPVIWAHPGRDLAPLKIAGKNRPRPINVWEMQHGFLAEHGTQFFNLTRERVCVEVFRNDSAGPEEPAWIVNRVR